MAREFPHADVLGLDLVAVARTACVRNFPDFCGLSLVLVLTPLPVCKQEDSRQLQVRTGRDLANAHLMAFQV